MVCKSCNAVNPEGKNFCGQCGVKLEAKCAGVPVPGDDGAFYCGRHKKTPTRLRCGRCDTPICTHCVVHGPAGVRCRDCARNRVALRPMGMLNQAGRQARYTLNMTIARYGVLGIIVIASLLRFVFGGIFGVVSAPSHLPVRPAKILPVVDHNSPQLKPLDWKSFLQDYSREFLTVEVWEQPGVPTEAWLKQNYPGSPGATEADISAAEERLGKRLPPSYRAFLKASNGWQGIGRASSPSNLIPVRDVAPIMSRHPDWIQGLVGNGARIPPEDHVRQRGDETYYRGSYLIHAIEVSDYSDGGFLCLCPDVTTPSGEWECWYVATGYPISVPRYPSFQAWMISQYGHIHESYVKGERDSATDTPSQSQ